MNNSTFALSILIIEVSTLSIAYASRRPVEFDVGENSNVCISVGVDRRLWSNTATLDTDRNLSGILGTQIRDLTAQRGITSSLSIDQSPRFVAELGGRNPACSDPDDTHVNVRYSMRHGRPFDVEWSIHQQQASLHERVFRDVEAEWRSGERQRLANSNPLQDAIIQDLRGRAGEISSHLHRGEH